MATPAPAPAPAPVAMQRTVVQPISKSKGSVRQGSGGRSSDFGTSTFMGLGKASPPTSTAQQFDDILVVDDSDVALKFMRNRLTRYGFRAELASSGEEALTRVSTEAYKFVFLDVMMAGLDGYQTCRAIKHRKYASGKAPVVVMLAQSLNNNLVCS